MAGQTQNSCPYYQRIKGFPLILFNIYILVWWLEIGKRVSFLGAIRIEFLIGALVAVFAINSYLKRDKLTANNKNIIYASILLIIVLLVSTPLSIDFKLAWQTFIDKVLKYALMTFFISQFVISPKTLQYFLFSSFIAFLKIGQEAFHGTITGNMIWYNQGIPRLHGTTNTMFGHPNSLSGKTVSSLSFIWYALPVIKKRWIKILIAIQLLFSLNIVLRTGSRTGYVTFIVLVLLIVIMSRRKLIALALACILSVSSIQFIPDDYSGRFMSIFGQEKQGRSKEARTNLFYDSLDVFSKNPLGVGLYCFPIAQQNNGKNPQETHNLYTQLLAETGIQGFLCFIALMALLLMKTREIKRGFSNNIENLIRVKETRGFIIDKKMPIDEEIAENKYMLAFTNALFIFIILRLILGIFGHDLLEIYWWYATGMTIAMNNILYTSTKRVDYLSTITTQN